VPSSGWFVVARLPTSEAFAPVTRLRDFVMNNTMIILPFFLLVMVFVMRHVMRPLMNAAKHADRMTHGEIPFEPLPVVRDDEVGHLTGHSTVCCQNYWKAAPSCSTLRITIV